MNEYGHCTGCNSQEKLGDLDYDGYCASCILEEQELNRHFCRTMDEIFGN